MVARPMLMVRLAPSARGDVRDLQRRDGLRSFSATSRAPPGEVLGSTRANSSPP
jgi:hypothetical protein